MVQGDAEIAWVVILLYADSINFEVESLFGYFVASREDCIGCLLYVELHFPEVAVRVDCGQRLLQLCTSAGQISTFF